MTKRDGNRHPTQQKIYSTKVMNYVMITGRCFWMQGTANIYSPVSSVKPTAMYGMPILLHLPMAVAVGVHLLKTRAWNKTRDIINYNT